MTKEKKQKIRKLASRIGAGFLCFTAGLAATFFLVPNRVRNIVFDDPIPEETTDETHFSKFVNKVMKAADVDSDETMEGLVGTIDNLVVEWPENRIEVNGSLALSMRSINDLDFTVDLNVNYNDREVDLGIGYVGRAFYLAFEDLYIKSSFNSTIDVIQKVYNLFFNPDVPAEEGLGIFLDIDGIIDSLISGLDLSSLMSGGSGLGIEFGEEKIVGNKAEAPLTIDMGEGKDPIELSLLVYTDTNDLAGANIKNITIDNVSISGGISLDVFKDHRVYAFDNENYDGYHEEFRTKNFIEVVNYKSWFDDIFQLINRKTVGIDFNFSVDQDDGTGAVNIGEIAGKIDVDASKFILPIPSVIDANTFAKDNIVVDKSVKRGEDGEQTIVEKVLDNLVVGLDLSASRDEEHYADVNLTYANQDAYLTFNEDIIKSKISIESLNVLIDKISTLVEGNPTDKARKIMRGEEPEEDLFSFITSSELVTAIKDGHYEGIIDVIESISNTEDSVTLNLNLSSLGLGDNAKVSLTFDASDNGEKGVTSIECRDIQMAEGIFNLDLETREYKEENVNKILNDKDTYSELDFIVGVFDQVTGILDAKQVGFELNGSVLGQDQLGMSFDGRGQVDYGTKYGFGDINIYNHKNADNPVEKTETHPVEVYFNNTTDNKEVNDMKLAYGPNGHLKGKLSFASLEDIVGVIGKIIDNNDRRFQKFLDPIMKIIYESVIGQIISSKDYMQLAKFAFTEAVTYTDNSLTIKLDKNLFAGFLTDALTLRLNFKVVDDKKELSSLQIIDLSLNESLGNKVVNCTITVKDFDPTLNLRFVDPNGTDFMNFSSLATLLAFGIDSTELNNYHLTADVKLNLGESIGIADIPLDFYIEVVGENTKVYGMFRNIPHIIVVSYDSFTTVSSEFLFEPAKHYDASSDDSIGGYFHIIRNEYHRITEQFEQYYYRCTSQGFLDDIVNYLLVSVINFRFTIVKTIGNIDLSTTKGTVSYEDMFMTNGFGYSENNGVSKWDVGLNLNNVTGIDALRTLDAHLYGEEYDANGVSKYYFNKLEGLLTVKASIITITLNATINLEDIDPSKHSWAEQFPDINARFEKVCNIYNGKTTSEKESYDQTYLNKSDKGCRIYLDSSMPSILA